MSWTTASTGLHSKRCSRTPIPGRSSSWAAWTGGPTSMPSGCCWTGSFRPYGPRSPRPGSAWSVGSPSTLGRAGHENPGVELHADVPDVRPYLATSGVMVVPLRIGGGSRLKILEAMAAGLPVISTSVGAEGLELVAGEHYLAADEPERIADALLAYIRDPRPARAMAERSRTFVLDRYDWDSLADRLERVWFGCLDR